ncbi:germin-like protein subfamily 3 member 4 [Pistacia vera]|uniref:germin-like protein subfamily 3 member 4 n=1 Tax=Pistacia vera TaxID=55513 RepID=UPI0012634C1E|nr:germin-like protein subfamily 3 member 4 [Pistacia vera]
MKTNLLFCIICFTCIIVCLADNDNLQDTCPTATTGQKTIFINGFPCKNPATIIASDFKSSKLKNPGNTDNLFHSSLTLATASDFPGLNTLGLSIGRTDLEVDGLVIPHSHPRASELFFVFKGVVIAGFVDTSNKVFQTVLRAGDVFVFPKGLLHFCFNTGFEFATVFSVLNSQNPGVVSISSGLFELDSEVIRKLERKLISVSKMEDNRILNETFSRFINL